MALPKKQKENTKGRFRFSTVLRAARNMDERTKMLLRRVAGGLLLFAAIYVFICCLSYLFTWKTDYSILAWSDVSEIPVNLGAKGGLRLSWFLVGGCFGMAAFAVPLLLAMAGLRLCRLNWGGFTVKSMVSVFVAAPLLSFLLSFLSSLFSLDNFFGGGLGGFAGAEFNRLCEAAVGKIGTGLILVVLVVFWLLFTSRRFVSWFSKEVPIRKKEENIGDGDDGTVTSAGDGSAEDGFDETCTDNGGPLGNGQDGEEYDTEDDEDAAGASATGEDGADAAGTGEPSSLGDGPVVTPSGGNSSASAAADAGRQDLPAGKDVIVETQELNVEVTEELPRIDNRMDLERYQFPSLDLLDSYADKMFTVSQTEQNEYIQKIRTTLLNFRIKVTDITAIAGPTVTLYKVTPAPGVKLASIKNIQNDIGIALGAKGVRVVQLADAVGIEVANSKSSIVPLKAMLNDESFRESKAELPVAIGCTITKQVKIFDLTNAPHLLVAGATQQGKSVGLNVIVSSLLYAKHPSELKFVFVDPKMVEFTAYGRLLKHYLAVLPTAASEEDEKENAIIKKAKDAADVLNSLCVEMDERYKLLAMAGVNKLKDYNEKYKDRHLLPTDGHKYLPYIVVVIDEFADLTMSSGFGQEGKALSRGISSAIIRLAQKGRAAGLHLIIATQRPSVSVITGDIKTNFPMRIAFRTVSRMDSMTILDSPGADNLIGRGDMLFYAGVEMERVQCAYVSTPEIDRITKFIAGQTGYKECYTTPYYLPSPPSTDSDSNVGPIDISRIDEMFADAARMVFTAQKGSTSDLQRKLGLGYARAGRIMDQLEAAGIVGPQEGSKPRQVMVSDFAELESIITSFTTGN